MGHTCITLILPISSAKIQKYQNPLGSYRRKQTEKPHEYLPAYSPLFSRQRRASTRSRANLSTCSTPQEVYGLFGDTRVDIEEGTDGRERLL